MINVILCGLGKMGKAVGNLVADSQDLHIFGAIEASDSPLIGQEVYKVIRGDSGFSSVSVYSKWNNNWHSGGPLVVTSFATPEATMEHALMSCLHLKPFVAGTTGLSPEQIIKLKEYAKDIPIVYDSNFSIGINVMDKVFFQLAQLLPDWDIEIVEKHHNEKKDAPSGTAVRLANTAAVARCKNIENVKVYSRDGKDCKRLPGQIGVQAIRAGDIIGEHEITIAGHGQRIELNHRAHSRDNFASGVIEAIRWVAGEKSGFFNMQDVQGLHERFLDH